MGKAIVSALNPSLGWLAREDIGVLAKIWKGIKACLGVSQFFIALAVVALLEIILVFGFQELNPYVCATPFDKDRKVQ